ncbi:MHYT domain-containing protein [Nocardia sienata]|uniref:MHYT domain-containing protein n=1 Tax=Nocardia sienata TaxID=248552 RepID=UPI0007A532AE|nr:MHYT domain-containing protein [Nocardia sienata]
MDMLHLEHFAFGWLTPALAYFLSAIGCAIGLQCTRQARHGRRRLLWLVLAAITIGGTGIWVMHFVAMLGFSIDGAQIRFDVPLTLLSAAISIGVVAIGLYLVTTPGSGLPALLTGGAVTGLGIAAMHYTGMAAMRTDAHIEYDPARIALSLVIATVVATATLWFGMRSWGIPSTLGAALILAAAVATMHYTGMSAMHAHEIPGAAAPEGAEPLQILGPLLGVISVVTVVLLIGVSMALTNPHGPAAQAAADPRPSERRPAR